MEIQDRRPAAGDALARVRSAFAAFGVALRQVWQGYWQSPPAC
jgi:hypothetical protein